MDVAITEAANLPDKAYLSIRVGEVRKQLQCKVGETFSFDTLRAGLPGVMPRHMVVDLFEKVASSQVRFSDVSPDQDPSVAGGFECKICMPSARGASMHLNLNVNMKGDYRNCDSQAVKRQSAKLSRHQVALNAKNYLDGTQVQRLLQDMVHELLAERPSDAIGFMINHLCRVRKDADESSDPPEQIHPPINPPCKDAALDLDGSPAFSRYEYTCDSGLIAAALERYPAFPRRLRTSRTADAFQAFVNLELRCIGNREHDFKLLCKRLGLSACLRVVARGDHPTAQLSWDISCCDQSETQDAEVQVETLLSGCQKILEEDARLEKNEEEVVSEIPPTTNSNAERTGAPDVSPSPLEPASATHVRDSASEIPRCRGDVCRSDQCCDDMVCSVSINADSEPATTQLANEKSRLAESSWQCCDTVGRDGIAPIRQSAEADKVEMDPSPVTCSNAPVCTDGAGSLPLEIGTRHTECSEGVADAVPHHCENLVDPDCAPFSEVDRCNSSLPDFANKHTITAAVFRSTPALYADLKNLKSPSGTQLACCIKPCTDICGHPAVQTVGLVAGDEFCYEIFRDLFDPVIRALHGNFDSSKNQVNDMDTSKITDGPLEEFGSGRIISTRIGLSRNLRNMRMLPACSADGRREVERLVATALSKLPPDLEGNYFPLAGSSTCHSGKPSGMCADAENKLREGQLLFEKPDSPVLIASGFSRDWPDARGIYVDESGSTCLWINETDHLRMTVVKEGANVKGAFGRIRHLHDRLQELLQVEGHEYAQSSRLGYLGCCPSRLGTCLDVSVTLRLPCLGQHPNFRRICRQLRLRPRMAVGPKIGATAEIWEVIGCDRLGSTEVFQTNSVISGCVSLLNLERRLEEEKVGAGADGRKESKVWLKI